MLWSERPTRLTGILFLAFVVCLVVNIVLSGAAGLTPTFERDEVDDLLKDVNDEEEAAVIAVAFSVAIDAALGIIAAPLLYMLFRDRGRLLALAVFAFLVANSVAFMVVDGINIAIIHLASDYAEGGAEGVAAGDAGILEIARMLSIITGGVSQGGFTALGLGLLALGTIIAYAPAGAVNPPRWLGWLYMVSGLAWNLSWFIALTDAGFIFFIIGGVTSLIGQLVLGVWLLRQPEDSAPMAAPARA